MVIIDNLSDEKLVLYIRQKDQETYQKIMQRYEKKLLRYALFLTGDREMALDAVQTAFIKAYTNLNSFNASKKFSSWIYRIVHNEAINLLSKNKKEVKLIEGMELDSRENPEDNIIKKEMIKMTHDCLDQMPLMYKEPLVLFYLQEKTYEEISDIVHIPVSTVGTRILRAKKLLKQICEKK